MKTYIVKTSYDIVTPESAEDGDVAESGWLDEEGETFATGLELLSFLRDKGVMYRSHYARQNTFEGSRDEDYATGAVETRYYHVTVPPKFLVWLNNQFSD